MVYFLPCTNTPKEYHFARIRARTVARSTQSRDIEFCKKIQWGRDGIAGGLGVDKLSLRSAPTLHRRIVFAAAAPRE
jgi:hypothetical protein